MIDRSLSNSLLERVDEIENDLKNTKKCFGLISFSKNCQIQLKIKIIFTCNQLYYINKLFKAIFKKVKINLENSINLVLQAKFSEETKNKLIDYLEM